MKSHRLAYEIKTRIKQLKGKPIKSRDVNNWHWSELWRSYSEMSTRGLALFRCRDAPAWGVSQARGQQMAKSRMTSEQERAARGGGIISASNAEISLCTVQMTGVMSLCMVSLYI